MRAHVVAHLAISVDGATTGFEPDVARFYALATLWEEDVTLVGSDTVLAQEAAVRAAPQPGPRPAGPLLAVVDSRGRVREWERLRRLGHWSDVLALYADQTPARPPDSTTPELVAGYEQVDLAEALDRLSSTRAARVVRVDSGGTLVGVLLGLGLVDEVSLLVHPVVTGARQRWYGGFQGRLDFRLAASEVFEGGVVWLRYCAA